MFLLYWPQKPEKGGIWMPDLNDFYTFKMSGGDSGGSDGDGCLSKILIAVVVIGLISLLGQCSG